MNGEFLNALEQLRKEKDIPLGSLLQTVAAAMSSAYRKHYGVNEEVRVEIDPVERTVRMFAQRPLPTISGEDSESSAEVPPAVTYEEHEIDITDFGRIAAQTAKQVVLQRVREAERERDYDEFAGRIGEVVTGEVQRRDTSKVFVALGRVEAILPVREQIPGEPYRFGDRVKLYIVDVRRTNKGPQIILSRSHPALVTQLFELEIPEVYEGIVEIMSVAREPGVRSKVAVQSHESQVDPVGACVGHRGARVQAIVDELRGEKIDIVRYDEGTEQYLKNALSPARVAQVVLHEAEHQAVVIAPDDQLSLAIGRRGQNVRLAAKLSGWKIDIRSQSEWVAAEEAAPTGEEPMRVYELARELGVESRDLVQILQEEGVDITSHASNVSGEHAALMRELLLGGEGTMEELQAGEILIDV